MKGWLGWAAIACYAVHGTYHLYHGRPEDLLWACHIGALFIGIGLLLPSLSLSGVGTLFLAVGTPLWLLELAGGMEFMATSLFTHIGALAIGLYAVRHFGMPRGVWWKALAGLIGLIILCRLTTPAEANVNIAFSVQSGWEDRFPSYPVYILTMIAITGLYFFVVEYLLQRWFVLNPESKDAS